MKPLPIGTGLVFAGERVMVPGVNVISYLDDPDLALDLPEDGRRRRAGFRVQHIVVHTTRGAPDNDDPRPQTILPGFGPSTRAGYEIVHDQRHNGKHAGEHLVIDHDGTVYQLADLVTVASYNATTVNDRAIGIEVKQGKAQNEIYVGAGGSLRQVILTCAGKLGIQLQMPDKYRGALARLASGGADFWGVYGHRDQTDNRSSGDPGDYLMGVVSTICERHNLLACDDKRVWRLRQTDLGFRGASAADGIPGPLTTYALAKAGYQHGLWALPPDRTAA